MNYIAYYLNYMVESCGCVAEHGWKPIELNYMLILGSNHFTLVSNVLGTKKQRLISHGYA